MNYVTEVDGPKLGYFPFQKDKVLHYAVFKFEREDAVVLMLLAERLLALIRKSLSEYAGAIIFWRRRPQLEYDRYTRKFKWTCRLTFSHDISKRIADFLEEEGEKEGVY